MENSGARAQTAEARAARPTDVAADVSRNAGAAVAADETRATAMPLTGARETAAEPATGRKAAKKRANAAAEWLDPVRDEPTGTHYQTFFSRTLQRPASYLIYFPPGYPEKAETRYPVIYWLHGLGGDQRTGARFTAKLDAAIRAGSAPAMIVVLVNGMRDRFYCDAPDGKSPVESVIVRDLVAAVDGAHRTIARREARIIEGASMGGLGAICLGFKYPDVFGAVSGVMPGLHDETSMAEMYPEVFRSVYGGSNEYFQANSPWRLVEKNVAALRDRTVVRLWIGGADQAWRQERAGRFHDLLDRLKIEHEYRVIPGVGHSFLPLYEKMGEVNWVFYRRALAGGK